MRRIDAIVRPEKTSDCLAALDVLGVSGVTVYEAKGHGAQGGVETVGEASAYRITLLPKTVLVVMAQDHEAESVVAALREAAYTGHMGDGKIFTSTLEDAVRVRTGEAGSSAL